MGKPAARMGDMTAHGGTIIMGKPTVLIGKMPAATMGDPHVCPMVTGVVPHVGGPITLGSMGVLICKTPAARLSDITVCVGPPSMPAIGEFTVLIGEAGSGSDAAGAASAASAASAAKNGPKAITPFDVAEPPEPRTENHWVEVEVTDSAGFPLGGVRYKLKDPAGKDVVGSTSTEGRIRHDGYVQAGSFKVDLQVISNAKWSKSEAKPGEELTLKADAEVFTDGTPAIILVFEERDGGRFRRLLANLASKVSGGKIEAKWTLAKGQYPEGPAKPEEDKKPLGRAEYYFMVEAGSVVAYSDRTVFNDTAEIKVLDENGDPIKEAAYEMHVHDGTVRKGKLDKGGKATEKDVPAGPYVIVLPEIVITAKLPPSKPKPSPKPGTAQGPSGISSTQTPKLDGMPVDSGPLNQPPEKIDMRFPLSAAMRKSINKHYHSGGKIFGYKRKKKKGGLRLHAGCDLVCAAGTPVYAVADGKIVRYDPFYMGTYYIEIDHGSFTGRYGEVQPPPRVPLDVFGFVPPNEVSKGIAISVNSLVKRGDLIGWVGELRELNHDGNQVVVNHMLHFEMYKGGIKGNLTVSGNKGYLYVPENPYERRLDLLNPTKYLDEAADA